MRRLRPVHGAPRLVLRRTLGPLTMLVLLGGCSTVTDVRKMLFTPRLRECKGFDVPLSVFIGPSRKEMRAKVVARNVDHDVPFVVETTADSLVLVGFTPLGTKAFTLERRGDDLEKVEVESFLGPGLTVPPTNFMQDVLAMSTPSACGTSASEVGVTRFEDWEVHDTCSGGRLVVRSVFRLEDEESENATDGQDVDAAAAEAVAGQTVLDGGGQIAATGPAVAGQAPEEYLPEGSEGEADDAAQDQAAAESTDDTAAEDAAASGDGSEIEITYAEDGIILYQKRCRYRARYVLEATPTEAVAEQAAEPVVVENTAEAAPAAAPEEATVPKVSGEPAE